MSIQITYDGTTYGPIKPTSLRTIFSALHISPRSSPCLVGLSDPHIALSDPELRVPPGLYALRCKSDVKWDDGVDSWPVAATKHPVPKPEPADPVPPTNEDQVEKQSEKTKTTISRRADSDDIDAGIEAMIYVISTIPARYVKYNKILAAQLDTALIQVDALVDALAQMRTTNPLLQPPSSTSTTTTKDPRSTYRTLIQYRLLTILQRVWSSVWLRFGPRFRYYHVTDVTTISALDRAEQTLNRLHVWRRTFDAQTWHQMQKSSTVGHVVNVAKLRRSGAYVPRVLDVDQPSTAWMYLTTPDARPSPSPKKSKSNVNIGEAVRDVRTRFLDVMLNTGLHHDNELDIVLKDIVNLRSVALQGHNTPNSSAAALHDDLDEYPADIVLRAIRKEFGIRCG
ncbi:hypothetical protein PhCBS80983_g03350 [Powellomyces hirtus]|uniref:Uncharacterized protein n=1 Tax=Powellomyces hirtus TaxID=109895 RepID=A0A507E4A7_9FUNG|nr:hypothetical protein PhCBS80983_g03350 [Powellomyces hirtus]